MELNASVSVWFENPKQAEQAILAINAQRETGFERSQIAVSQNQAQVNCKIKASDESAFKSAVHGSLKSLALIQKIQKTIH